MKINIHKLTNLDLLRRANEFTTGQESAKTIDFILFLFDTLRVAKFTADCDFFNFVFKVNIPRRL